jgi:hypothetical protein
MGMSVSKWNVMSKQKTRTFTEGFIISSRDIVGITGDEFESMLPYVEVFN